MHHVSLRPRIGSAAHLYAVLQLGYADSARSLVRAFILLGTFLALAVTPTAFLWRVGVVGAGLSFAWLAMLAVDHIARHWFMDALTLQDAFAEAPGQFGGDGDVDTYLLRAAERREAVQLLEVEAYERQQILDRANAAVEDAQAAVVDLVDRMQADSLLRAEGPSDSAH